MNRHQALCHCHFGKVADATQVVRLGQCHDAAAVLLGAGHAQLHGLNASDLAIATLGIQGQQTARIQQHLDARVGLEATFQHRIDVTRHHAHAMRVVSTQIGHHQIGCHRISFRLQTACCYQNKSYLGF